MQALTEKLYLIAPPGGLFDESVVRNLFPSTSAGGRKLLVHRASAKGEILRLKPGLYCLAPDYRKSTLHPFVVAAALHSPSHVSMESALAYHGLIPEAVYQVSSVTIGRTRRFKTPLGVFTFSRVPTIDPMAGVRAEKVDASGWAFVASPIRASAGLVYLRKEIRWESDGLRFLTDSLRIDEDEMRRMHRADLDEVHRGFKNLRTKSYLEGLRKELSR